MGCIRSKLIHHQDENEEGYVFDDIDKIQSTGFKLDIVEEIKSFEKIGNGGAVAVLDLGAGKTQSDADDSKQEKSVDDYDLAKRMQLLRDVAELQMTQLRLARDRFHWSIIQRDARRVVASLKSHPFDDEESENIQTNGEISLTGNDATELKETESKNKSPAKEDAIWLLDVVINNIDYDAQKVEDEEEQELEQEDEQEQEMEQEQGEELEQEQEQEQKEEQEQEEMCDDKDTEVPDLGFFQNIIKTQMKELGMARDTLRRSVIQKEAMKALKIQSSVDREEIEKEQEDLKKEEDDKDKEEKEGVDDEEETEEEEEEETEEKDEEKKEEGEEDEGEEKNKEKKKDEEKMKEEEIEDEEKEEEDDEEFECDDNDTHLPEFGYFQFKRLDQTRMTTRRHSRLPSPSSATIDQPIESERILLDDYNNLNSPDQVYSHDITTDLNQSQPNDEESSIDEDREKRRLQWLANRKSTNPAVHCQQELQTNTQPREIDIDSAVARKKFPWMR